MNRFTVGHTIVEGALHLEFSSRFSERYGYAISPWTVTATYDYADALALWQAWVQGQEVKLFLPRGTWGLEGNACIERIDVVHDARVDVVWRGTSFLCPTK